MKIRRITVLLFAILPAWLAVLAAAAAEQAKIEDVPFTAKCDNSQQNYVLIYPEGFKADQPHDILIALHGHGSDRWQFAKGDFDEARAARDVASAHRMLFVSPDYRAKTSWMGPKAEADVVQIIAELKSRFKIGKTILCGGSMGGSSALTFAAMHPELIDGVASFNGTANHLEYENFQDAIQESFGGTKRQIPAEYKKRSAEYWPEKMTMPVAATVGGQDTVVPPQSVIRLMGTLKKLQPNVLLIFRESGGHSTEYKDAKEALDFVVEKAAVAPAKENPSRSARGTEEVVEKSHVGVAVELPPQQSLPCLLSTTSSVPFPRSTTP
jgi:predicted esterase